MRNTPYFVAKLAFAGIICLMATGARADTYQTVPHPTAVWDSTTGAAYAIGIPGQGQNGLTVLPSAATTNTWTGTNNFTGPTTLTVPTVNNPIISGPAPVACGATCTVTAANAGETVLLNQAAGSVATLPVAAGTGNTYKFVVSVTVTSNADKILAASTSDALTGTEIGWTGSTAKVFSCGASSTHAIQMPFAGTQPQGGFQGDVFTYTDIGTNLWLVQGVYQAGATPTTPCSATNS